MAPLLLALAFWLAADGERLECLKSWTEARYGASGYDHWVHLDSACSVSASCSVATSVNPNAVEVAVPPGEHVAVLTWRGSPAREFTAVVRCRAVRR
jgi:hypothetical protein